MSDTVWSSETLGWALLLTRRMPVEIEKVPKVERAEALRKHYEGLFKRLKFRIGKTDGKIRIVSMQEYIGSACVVGDEIACRLLKQEFERTGFATMIENKVCIGVG